MNYDLDYFIKKFEAIPENRFCIGNFMDGNRRCFLGHTMPKQMIIKILAAGNDGNGSTNYQFSKAEIEGSMNEVRHLCILVADGRKDKNIGSHTCIQINNGDHPDYQQSTPKQRILAALYDLKLVSEARKILESERIKELVG